MVKCTLRGSAVEISERAHCMRPQRGPPAQRECFLIITEWFFVIREMNMVHIPRAGQSQVDAHVRIRALT